VVITKLDGLASALRPVATLNEEFPEDLRDGRKYKVIRRL
jgi:hypothetical protein